MSRTLSRPQQLLDQLFERAAALQTGPLISFTTTTNISRTPEPALLPRDGIHNISVTINPNLVH